MGTVETTQNGTNSTPSVVESKNTTTGRVKWFNNKSGYGFITSSDGEDVFVHHSAIKVSQEQYRYLVQGEYVEYTQTDVANSNHKYQAGDVKGINNGKLMCETRHESRESRLTHVKKDSNKDDGEFVRQRPERKYKPRSPGNESLRSRQVTPQ